MIFDPSKETRPEVLAAEEEYFGCKPCFEKGRNRHVFQSGFNAGAASRDAEVVSLTNQRDYEYVRAENAEQERAQFEQESDQLRAQINVLRHILGQVKEGCLFADDDGGIGVSSECQVDSVLFDEINKALSATPEQSLAASELRKERDALLADNERLREALRWRDVSVDGLPTEAQEILFIRDGKALYGAFIGGVFWYSNKQCAALYWKPMPEAQEALAATPAQSLARIRNQMREECALVCLS